MRQDFDRNLVAVSTQQVLDQLHKCLLRHTKKMEQSLEKMSDQQV